MNIIQNQQENQPVYYQQSAQVQTRTQNGGSVSAEDRMLVELQIMNSTLAQISAEQTALQEQMDRLNKNVTSIKTATTFFLVCALIPLVILGLSAILN